MISEFGLFDESTDLLSIVNLENELIQKETMSYIFNEYDMMNAIYENMLFTSEQNNMILESLLINEGAGDIAKKIGQGIIAILKKIKELIGKFINFILEKLKIRSSKVDKKIIDTEEETSKKIENTMKNLKNIENQIDDQLEPKKELIEKALDDIKKEIEEEMVYTSINISPEAIKETILESNLYALDGFELMINSIHELAELMQNRSKYDKFHKYCMENKDALYSTEATRTTLSKFWCGNVSKLYELGFFHASEQFKYDAFENINLGIPKVETVRTHNIITSITTEGKCTYEIYYSNYYKNAKIFFKDYENRSKKGIENIKNFQNGKLKELEKKCNDIIKIDEEIYSFRTSSFITRTASTCLRLLSIAVSKRLSYLTTVDNAYSAYCKNAMITNKIYQDTQKLAS